MLHLAYFKEIKILICDKIKAVHDQCGTFLVQK